MTVVATLHQPSSEILHTFDRLIVLADGMTVYNGLVSEIPNFLRGLGYNIGKYQNPADVLLKMAHEPAKIHPGLTLKKIALTVEDDYLSPIDERRLSRRVIAAQYKKATTDYGNEFYLLMKRYFTLAVRIPIGFVAVIMMALSNSFFIASIFGGVGS